MFQAVLLHTVLALGTADGNAILRKVDRANNPFSDQQFTVKMVVREASGATEDRELTVWQRGKKRLIRFAAPADVRGMSILLEDRGTMYVYLPAFKKVRRVAMHARNASFLGSDFTYDEMAAVRWAPDWDATRAADDGGQIVLTLARKKRRGGGGTMKMWIDAGKYLATKIEYYDADGRHKKTETRGAPKEFRGKSAQTEIAMTDVASGHATLLTVVDMKVDQDLSEDLFSKRSLDRAE